MTAVRTLRLGVAIVTIAGLGFWWWHSSRKHAPLFPQFRRQVVERMHDAVTMTADNEPGGHALVVPPPVIPAMSERPIAVVYRTAVASGEERPGAMAFHAETDLFCDYNQKAAEDKARQEGITVGEVRELTFFGFAAMRTTQRATISRSLGRPLSAEEARKVEQMMQEESRAFTAALRAEVDRGATEAERWRLIRDWEQKYVQQFQTSLGMTAAQFDKMLEPDDVELGRVKNAVPPDEVAPPPPPEQPSTPEAHS